MTVTMITTKPMRSFIIALERVIPAGFTLIELLVVIAIIGILIALLLPVLSRVKGKAQGIECMSNGQQMIRALHMYAEDNGDWMPPNPEDTCLHVTPPSLLRKNPACVAATIKPGSRGDTARSNTSAAVPRVCCVQELPPSGL